MRFLGAIYTCKIFNNGRFCFKVTKRMKTIDDYRNQSRISLIIIVVTAIFLTFK